MTKTEQLAAAFAKLEEAGKLLRDAGEERLAEETDQPLGTREFGAA
jgi:hypothetical protein